MVTSLKNLKNEVDSRLAAGGLDALACCQLQNAQTILNSCVVTSVANTASLPSASLNEGRFIYVDDINEYRFANDTAWTDDVSSTITVYQRQLWGWGNNSCGNVGNENLTGLCTPVREISSSSDWCQVAGGACSTAAIKTSGQLWTWGANGSGRLGAGVGVNAANSPIQEFCSATDWCQVSSNRHTVAVKTSGQIWAWGYGSYGRLGDGAATNRCSPVRERSSSTDWCRAAVGYCHTAAIKTSGQIWTWGANSAGQLGDGTQTNRSSPVREISSSTDWCQVSTYRHTAAIKTTGEMWTWGCNECGILGTGSTTPRCSPVREFCSATDWCQVSASFRHNTAVKTTGQIWGWGWNVCGQLGIGSTSASDRPARELTSSTDWCQTGTGYEHSAGLKTTGQIWSWGRNNAGNLGNGIAGNTCSPVREVTSATDWCRIGVGTRHTMAIKGVCKGFLE